MEGEVIRCPSCGRANRVPNLEQGRQARCGQCKAALPGIDPSSSELPLQGQRGTGAPLVADELTFNSIVAGTRTVVDFWAPWCGPCRTVAPVIESLAAERRDVTFAKVNVDDHPSVAARFKISGIPTLVFFSEGTEKGRLVGAAMKPQIEQAIANFLS